MYWLNLIFDILLSSILVGVVGYYIPGMLIPMVLFVAAMAVWDMVEKTA